MARPDVDVMQHIAAALPQLTWGTNAFSGPLRPVKTYPVVFATLDEGRPEEPIGAASLGGRSIQKPRVRIRVRASKEGKPFVDGQELADACLKAINRKPPAGYCDARVVRATARHLGKIGDDQRHEWQFDVDLMLDVRDLAVFWGVGAAGINTEPGVLALAGTALAPFRYREITVTPAVGEKIYYWVPDTFLVPTSITFTVGSSAESWATTPVTVGTVAGTLYERAIVGTGSPVTVIVG